MALAYGDFHEISHQLRFLLFEIGIGLPQNSINYFISFAHDNTLKRLEHAALLEGLTNSRIISHHVHDFIEQLQRQLKSSNPTSILYQWNNIREELDESIANETLALAYKLRWNAQICNEANSCNSLWSWVKNELSPHNALLFLEQWGSQDHHYHPCFRAKIGFTRREVLQNSAEFQAKINLHWCALRDDVLSQSPDNIEFKTSMALNFPLEYKLWQEKLLLNHLSPQDYIPIPVHPWQWRNKLQTNFSPYIDNKSLILLPHHQAVMPSISEGLMMPVIQSNNYIKLQVDIQTPYTSVGQNQVQDYQHEFTILKWIHSLLTCTQYYGHSLFLASKLTALRTGNLSKSLNVQQQLSANIIQNPANLLQADQRIVPLSSLFTYSPISNKPLLIEIIKASGLAPMTYFSMYCHRILFSQLHLLLQHGIAFETQPHNLLVIFTGDIPQGLIIRDNEQCNITHTEWFNNQKPTNLNNSIKNNTLHQLNSSFIHGALQNNLSYWINCLKKEYRVATKQLWNIVYQVMQTILQELSKEINHPFFDQQKHHLFYNVWQHECLLTMRLRGNMNKNIYIKQPNPLNDVSSI